MKKQLILLPLLLFSQFVFSQDIVKVNKTFAWSAIERHLVPTDPNSYKTLIDQETHFDQSNGLAPTFSKQWKVSRFGSIKMNILSITYDQNNYDLDQEVINRLPNQFLTHTSVNQDRQNYLASFQCYPVFKEDGQVRVVKSMQIEFILEPKASQKLLNPPVNESILNEGQLYKFSVSETGIHKLTGSDLEAAGISLGNIDAKKIQVFGNPGGVVPRANIDSRYDDLTEIPVLIKGTTNSTFEADDELIFFAEGATTYKKSEDDFYQFIQNPFDFENYIFIRLNVEGGKRISQTVPYQADNEPQSDYLHITRYEEDHKNLLDDAFGTEGSGLEWYDNPLGFSETGDNLNDRLTLSNFSSDKYAKFSFACAMRDGTSNQLKVELGPDEFTQAVGGVNLGNTLQRYAQKGTFEEIGLFSPTSLSYNVTGISSEGKIWLDFAEVQYRRNISYSGNEMKLFMQKKDEGIKNITVQGNGNTELWTVTNYHQIIAHQGETNGNSISFSVSIDSTDRFVLFNNASVTKKPVFVSSIDNQNLHNISNAEMLIIAHPSIADQANQLASYRSDFNGYDVKVINVEEIYNEFSGGRCDPSGIRDFIRMIYDRDSDLQYILLFGRGSFDFRGIEYDKEIYNLIPVFETDESLHPVSASPSDDFYTLLDIQEGDDFKGKMDVAIGRFPVNNVDDAQLLVDKVIDYETNPELLGNWNLNTVFLADDSDSNTHMRQVESISESSKEKYKDMNTKKIYFDAFVQKSTPGGERFPEVTSTLNNQMYQGALTICYLGHGGPTGWAQERVLQNTDIANWENEKSFPLFITATCSFAPYDDPDVVSAGENVIINDNGGIALFTTARAVYSYDNERLTRSVFDTIFTKENGEYLGLGEILRRAKNKNQQDTVSLNARKFILLGDPAMKLLLPKLEVYTTKINGKDVTVNPPSDTLGALSTFTIEGYVRDDNQVKQDFDGKMSVTIYDKEIDSKTLGQDNKVFEYKDRRNIIFRGNVGVTDGDFSFTFTAPKDILFDFGTGKISYYADNGNVAAAGHYNDLVIGGVDSIGIDDDTPPVVQVYMNNEDFVTGGITNPNPVLYAIVSDDYGINLSGTAVGHDLVGILDDKKENTYILNDFFQSELNNFKKGTIEYPLTKLENGKHTIKVEAWDIANNVGEGYIEFYVSDDPTEGLKHVLNYPNPFSTNTSFQFEHNLAGSLLDIQVDIYTVSGKLIKTVTEQKLADGFRVADIAWDGLDDFGQKISSGTYIYKIKVESDQFGEIVESNFEKLVILK